MVTKTDIKRFLSLKSYALAGVSRSNRKFGNALFKELQQKNYTVYPVNPNMQKLNEYTCYTDISSLPEKAEGVIISVSPAETINVLKDVEKAGISMVWIQQGAESKEAVEFCKEKGITAITNKCLLMFLEPAAFPHNFHRWLLKVFGKLPV